MLSKCNRVGSFVFCNCQAVWALGLGKVYVYDAKTDLRASLCRWHHSLRLVAFARVGVPSRSEAPAVTEGDASTPFILKAATQDTQSHRSPDNFLFFPENKQSPKMTEESRGKRRKQANPRRNRGKRREDENFLKKLVMMLACCCSGQEPSLRTALVSCVISRWKLHFLLAPV